jgi:hypothetical protein
MIHAKIDSFKLTITLDENTPLHIAKLYNALSRELLIVDAQSGNVEQKQTKHSIKLTTDNYISSIEISKAMLRYGKTRKQALTLKISSKLLREHYYKGISIETLPLVLSYLNEVLEANALPLMTFDDLLDSKITDVDICKDLVLNQAERKTLCLRLARLVEPSSHTGNGYRYFYAENKRLSGCQLQNRESATLKKPFVKTYDKHSDSESRKHSAFFKHYEISTPKGLQRLEVTLKDYKHLEVHKVSNTLRDLMKLCSAELEVIIGNTIRTYEQPTIRQSNEGSKYMNQAELILQYMMLKATKQGKTALFEIRELCNYIESIDPESRALRKHSKTIESKALDIDKALKFDDPTYRDQNQTNSKVELLLFGGNMTN